MHSMIKIKRKGGSRMEIQKQETIKKKIRYLFAFFIGLLFLAYPFTVEAKKPLILTYHQTSNTSGDIYVDFDESVSSVMLPNGLKIVEPSIFSTSENGAYDFVAYDQKGRPTQQTITVDTLDVDDALVTTAHGLYIKLNPQAFDTVSGVKEFRYRINNSSWSNWIPYEDNNVQEIQIPKTNQTNSFVEEQIAYVEFKDQAGNIRSTQTKFRVDHAFPEIQTSEELIYSNTGKTTIPLIIESYIKMPDTLIFKEGKLTKTVDLTKTEPIRTLLERRPNKYRGDWKDFFVYEMEKTQGVKEIEIIAIKTYRDFKGNEVQLASNSAKKLRVIFDETPPTGTILIQSNGKNEVESNEVELDLSFQDNLSGVEKVRVFEGNKEYYLKPNEITAGKAKLPWTLNVGKNGQVWMEVTDKAGNSAIIESNQVTISRLHVSGFALTEVVNPSAVNFLPRYWQYDGTDISMIGGGSFSFDLFYNLGFVDPSRYQVIGSYQVTLVDPDSNEILYESENIPFKESEAFNEDNEMGDAGFSATFTLPSKDKFGNAFEDNTKVYLSATITRVELADNETKVANFHNANTRGNLIGVIRKNVHGHASIDEMIRFNERN